ncbi:repeat protein [Moumouvirus goulette]|uniref:Repeat protein n=1 Tax=Moumouvirus goulette TaxID=1247379 RepID=M1NNV0_9VIRU|nr:repeat protein [Moumouvirus goulette]AGF85745.1 repeat protein [Moumouvirus goulette]
MSSKLYFKIINEIECHHGFQYVDGLNILQEKFNNNPKDSCVPGRLYFSKPKYMCKYLDFGVYLREIYLPTDNPKFKMIKDPSGDKYGANMIILGKRRDLKDIETWKYMISVGVDIYINDNYALKWASTIGYLEIVKYLVESGADIHVDDDYALKWASNNGHLEVVKYLVENGAKDNYGYALVWASEGGHLEIVKCLIENGANIHALDDKAFRLASKNGHFEIVKYLLEHGADIKSGNDYALRWAFKKRHTQIIFYLLKNGLFTNQKLVRRLINKYNMSSIEKEKIELN